MAVALLPAAPAIAADHRDGASVDTDPSTDINDVYSWVDAGGQSVYLAMTVFPVASTTSKFSNSAYYVFHTTSRATAAGAATPLDITCGFDNAATQNISCWIGDSTNFIYGNASNAADPRAAPTCAMITRSASRKPSAASRPRSSCRRQRSANRAMAQAPSRARSRKPAHNAAAMAAYA